jgi:hypothetical protein
LRCGANGRIFAEAKIAPPKAFASAEAAAFSRSEKGPLFRRGKVDGRQPDAVH